MRLELRPHEGQPATVLQDVTEAAARFPGLDDLTVVVGDRRVTLGQRVHGASAELRARLSEFGEVRHEGSV